jgi:hypothetical protein
MAGYQEGSKNRLPTIDMPSLTLVMNLIDTLSVWHIICRGPMSPYGLSICFHVSCKQVLNSLKHLRCHYFLFGSTSAIAAPLWP